MSDQEGPLAPGKIVQGGVVAHHPWGVELELTDVEAHGTVDVLFLSDDPRLRGPEGFPAIGAECQAVVQGTMPNGQLRLSLRASDLRQAREPQ